MIVKILRYKINKKFGLVYERDCKMVRNFHKKE